MIDSSPPNAVIVCIQTSPNYPPGTDMITMAELKKLSRIVADYEAQESHRLKFETDLAKERPDLNFKPYPGPRLQDMGVFVVFKRDCPSEPQ